MTTDQLSPEDVQRVTDDLAEGPVPESRATSTDTGALLIAFFKRPREEGTASPTSSRKRGERSAVMLCPVKERPEGLRAFLRLGLPGEAAKTVSMVAKAYVLRVVRRVDGTPQPRRRATWPAREPGTRPSNELSGHAERAESNALPRSERALPRRH